MPQVGAISASVNFDISNFLANAKRMSAEAFKSFGDINKNVGAATNTLGGLNSQLQKLNTQLQNVAIGSKEFKTIQKEIASTQKQLNAATQSGGKFAKISELAGQAGFNGMQLFSAGIKGAAVALAGLAISKAVTLGLAFEKQMSEVGAAANATGKDFETLENKARKLGATTSFSATQAAEGMTELAKAGLNTTQILTGTEAVLNLAKSGSIGLGEAATIAADTMSQFGLEAEDLGRISDLLAKSANASTIGVIDMGETLKYVGGVAKSASISIEQVSAATALLGNAGIKGSMAGTALKTIITSLSAPSREGEVSLKRLKLSMTDLQDKNGSLKKLPELFSLLQSKSKNLSDTAKADIFKGLFGTESMTAGLALMDVAGEKYNAMVNEMEKNSTGFAKKYGDALSNNVKGKLDNLSSGMEEVFLKIWDAIKPVVSILVSLTNSIVNIGGVILESLLRPFKELFEFIQPAFAWIIAISEELIMKWLNLEPLFMAIQEAMHPVVDLFLDLGKLTKSLYDNFILVVNEVKTLFAIFNTGGDSMFTPIVDAIKAVYNYLTEVSPLVLAVKLLLAPIVIVINAIVFSIRSFVALFELAGNVISKVYEKMKPILNISKLIYDAVMKIISGKFNFSFEFGDLTGKILKAFNFDSISNFFSQGFSGIWDSLSIMASEFWEKFLKYGKQAVNGVKDFFSNSGSDLVSQMQKFQNRIDDIKKERPKAAPRRIVQTTESGKEIKTPTGDSELQPIFARVKENVGNIADPKGTIKLFTDLKSQLKDIEQSSVLFGSKTQQSLAALAVKIKTAGQVLGEFGKGFTDILAASAQLKNVKFDNFKQNLQFVAGAMNKLIDDGLKNTINTINAETNMRIAGYDAQLAAFADNKKKEEELQKEHDLEMQRMKAELDTKSKTENDRLFEEQAAKLNAEYEAQIERVNLETTDATERAASEETLLAQQEEAKIALRQQFDQRLIEQVAGNQQTIEQKNAEFEAAKEERIKKDELKKQAIEDQKTAFLAEQENKRTQAQDIAAQQKEQIQKRAALIEWQAGKGAFEANKMSQRANIQMNMGMMALQATAGIMASFAKEGTTGAIIAAGIAGGLLVLGLAAAATSLAAVSSAQYPPPPIFADGGIIGGSSHANGGTMINAEKGEMILNQGQQAQLFNAANGKGSMGGTTNIYLDGVKIQNMTNADPATIADTVGRIIRQSTYQAVTR